MNDIDIYDRSGAPISMEEYIRLLRADLNYKRVARTKITDLADPAKSFDVSTVWLGLDHSHGRGALLIFETMVFAEGSSLDEACDRYSTEQEALQGHRGMVATVAAELTDPVVIDVDETAAP